VSHKTGQDLIDEAKAAIRQVTPEEAQPLHGQPGVTFLDCREPNEWNLGRIPGAVFIPRGNIETKVEGTISREQRVVIYCASGNRSALAAVTMTAMGYPDVVSMSGGFRGWVQAGGDVEG
jgi:rhodanese-related sulfurtransferase